MIEEAAKLLVRSRDFGYLDLAFEKVSQNMPQRGRRGEAASGQFMPGSPHPVLKV